MMVALPTLIPGLITVVHALELEGCRQRTKLKVKGKMKRESESESEREKEKAKMNLGK